MKVIGLIVVALVALARADFPLDNHEASVRSDADETYRLPEDLDPIHCEVEVTPYFEAEEGKEAFTFDGIITLTVRAVKENLNSFVIQENVRDIVSVTLTDESGNPVRLNVLNPFERIRQYHFLQVNLAAGTTLVNGAVYKLTVEYIGNINETPLSRGVFRGNYVDNNGVTHWYAATHLQPTNSRQAFPSFDEPGFKSTFDIIINRPASFGESFSNMHLRLNTTIGNRVREEFYTTPRMSAYLVTFHISEEFTVIADNHDSERSYRILARPNAQGQGEYALEVGPPLTDWLSDYFDIDYYSMEENIKNDQIASPYWASGATENWGLVTYRELRLLYEEGETNALDKMYIGTITAHELAHKWFGNLITCRWWDNVWINEGFASYFEYFAMDGIDKSLELEDQFNLMYLQSALSTDSALSTRALQHAVNSPTEVTGHFSGISYSKGASLLLMLKHLVSENTFKKALNDFLIEKSYEHAFPSDLYESFERAVRADGIPSANFDIAGFMQYWVDEQGYPVLTVDINMETGVMSLTQERFFISADAAQTQQRWPLPITYTTGRAPNWNNLQPSYVMTLPADSITKTAGEEWVIFNVQQKNIYRVNYDAHNWHLLAEALDTNHNNIHHLNRAQIVDDVFALMRSGRMTYELGFHVLQFLKKDTSYYVWYPAITGFNWLRNRFLHLPDVLAEFEEILYEFMDAAIEHLTYDVATGESLTTTLNRFFLLQFACNIGHTGCLADADAKFSALVNQGTPVNPNLRRHVFCRGLRNGGLQEFTFMRNRRQNSNNQADDIAMLRALGCTTNEAAGIQFLNMMLTPEVKAQDRVNAFTFYLMGDRNNAKIALDWFKDNVDAVRQATQSTEKNRRKKLSRAFNHIKSNPKSDSMEALIEAFIFVTSILCALVGHAVGGYLGWPGATAVGTVIPGETKTTGYSTTQYINTLPASYSYGAQPQFVYQVPQVSSFAPLSNGYYSLPGTSYISATNFIYPAQSTFVPALGSPAVTGGNIIPGFPGIPSLSPSPSNPAPPLESQTNPLGDSDSDVIESADFSRQQQNQQGSPSVSTSSRPEVMQSSQQASQQFLPNNFPNYQTVPQIPQAPTFPSQLPQIPQFPPQPPQAQSNYPSSSQGSQLASFPSIPQNPQNPQQSISSSPLYQSPQMTQPGQASGQAPTLPLYPPYHQQPNFPPTVFPQGQGPSPSQPTSFQGATNNDSSLNNDDTITIESA